MRYIWVCLVGLFLLVPFGAHSQADPGRISVEGVGRVSAVPDMAVVRLGVQREARDAEAAMTAASEAMSAVMSRITEAGIEPEDVQTAGIGLNPTWRHSQDGSPPRVMGYVASNDLTVRVRDLGRLGDLLTAVVSDGANTMNGLSFEVSDTAALEDQARVLAVEDAMRKARVLADAAGTALGDVISLAEGRPAVPGGPMLDMAMSERAAVPVAAGQVDIVVTVQAVFVLGDG